MIRPRRILLFLKVGLISSGLSVLVFFLPPQKILSAARRLSPGDLRGRPPRERYVVLRYANRAARCFAFGSKDKGCLVRAIVLFCFLQAVERDLQIVLGIRREEGKIRGHAWLETAGKPFPPEGRRILRYERLCVIR
jgi:hypothetical protein